MAPSSNIIYIAERGSKFQGLTENKSDISKKYEIFAGKFRRYNGESWFKRITDVNSNLLNLRDGVFVLFGIIQSLILLIKLKPNIIFLKGGLVSLPIGLAAAFLKIPYITHDSDSLPGLSNRVTGRWAKYHATGMPEEYYSYPKGKVRFVGIPLDQNYKKVDTTDQIKYKQMINLAEDKKLLLILGGSSGSDTINKIASSVIPKLLSSFQDLIIILQAGKGKAVNIVNGNSFNGRLIVKEYLDQSFIYSGAADIVITRGGATNFAELAIQAKPTIVIPNPFLTGGHQLKNAQQWSNSNAAIVLQEKDLLINSDELINFVNKLITDQNLRQELSVNIHKIAIPDSANQLARLILELGNKK